MPNMKTLSKTVQKLFLKLSNQQKDRAETILYVPAIATKDIKILLSAIVRCREIHMLRLI